MIKFRIAGASLPASGKIHSGHHAVVSLKGASSCAMASVEKKRVQVFRAFKLFLHGRPGPFFGVKSPPGLPRERFEAPYFLFVRLSRA